MKERDVSYASTTALMTSGPRSRARPCRPSAAIAWRMSSVTAHAASTSTSPTKRAELSSPATDKRQRSASFATSRTSPMIAPSPIWPRPSTTTDTLGPNRGASPARSIAVRIAAASRVGLVVSLESMPASGLVSTGTPVRTAIPSASTSSPSKQALSDVRPLIWMLPRAVTSTMPLPCRAADSQSPIKTLGAISPASGLSRTNRPSPVDIGAERAGQAPRREKPVMPQPRALQPRR